LLSYFAVVFCCRILLSYFAVVFCCRILLSYFAVVFLPPRNIPLPPFGGGKKKYFFLLKTPRNMWWSSVLENCIKRAIRTRPNSVGKSVKLVRVVLSPDVDGVLSACLLSQYLWEKHQVETEIVGTYNGRYVRAVNDVSVRDLCDAIWLDLDTRFTEVRTSIGNHFLGRVRMATGSFNPNALFQIENFYEKYPFATTHLLLFGPLRSMTIPGLHTGMGKAAVAHADSCYYVCQKYVKNVQKWADRLFDDAPTPDILQSMMTGAYMRDNRAAHQQFVNKIEPHVYRGKMQTEVPDEWKTCTGYQTCRAQNGVVQFRNVHALIKILSEIMQTKHPVIFDPLSCRTVWTGTKLRVEPSIFTEDLEQYMQTYNIRSHAITSFRVLSMTQGPPLVSEDDSTDVTFY